MFPLDPTTTTEASICDALNNLNERIVALENAAAAGGISPSDRAILNEAGAFFGVAAPAASA